MYPSSSATMMNFLHNDGSIPGETGVAETVDFTSRLSRKSSVVVPSRSAAVASVARTNVGSSVTGTVGGVESWLKELGLEDRAGDFKREAITVEALARMDDSQLQAMGVDRMGDRLTLLGRARDVLGRLDGAGSGSGMPPGLQRKKAMDAGSKVEALEVAEVSFGEKRSVNLSILQAEQELMLIDPAHRKTLLKTLSIKQTFRNQWSGLPQMSTALRIAPIHITGHLSAEDGEYVSVVMKNLREYWGNIAVIASLLVSTLLPVLFMNDPALAMRRESWDSSARRKSTGAGEDSAGSLFMTGDWVLRDEHLSYIGMTFAMLMSLATCLSLLTLASALVMHIQLFVIMVDLADQIHFLTHTRIDLPHRLMIASLLATVAALPFGHLLVYGFYPAIWLAFLCVSITVGIYSSTLHMRKRAAGLLQHKFETVCTMMNRGNATYMRSIIAQRLLRRYFNTFKQIWREKVLREEQGHLAEEEDEMDQRYTHPPKCRKSAPSDLI